MSGFIDHAFPIAQHTWSFPVYKNTFAYVTTFNHWDWYFLDLNSEAKRGYDLLQIL